MVSHLQSVMLVSPSTSMQLRVIVVLLASIVAITSQPVLPSSLKPASMRKRVQDLINTPSRAALADVLYGPDRTRQELALYISESRMTC